MTPTRAKRIIELCDCVDDYNMAIKEFPTLLLLLAQEVADMSREWEQIGYSKQSEDVIRRSIICTATYDLCLHSLSEARSINRPTKDLPGIAHDVYMGPSGDNPEGYSPTPPDQMEDPPHLDPEPPIGEED